MRLRESEEALESDVKALALMFVATYRSDSKYALTAPRKRF